MAKSGVFLGLGAALFGVIAMGGLIATPAHAAWCHMTVGALGPNGEAGNEEYVCEGSNASAPSRFTAIAISNSTLAWGSSWAANSQAQAEQLALGNCRKYARDCKAVDWARYKCLALAVSQSDKTWGVDTGDYPETASTKALAQCRSAGGKSCVVQTHPCSQD